MIEEYVIILISHRSMYEVYSQLFNYSVHATICQSEFCDLSFFFCYDYCVQMCEEMLDKVIQ